MPWSEGCGGEEEWRKIEGEKCKLVLHLPITSTAKSYKESSDVVQVLHLPMKRKRKKEEESVRCDEFYIYLQSAQEECEI